MAKKCANVDWIYGIAIAMERSFQTVASHRVETYPHLSGLSYHRVYIEACKPRRKASVHRVHKGHISRGHKSKIAIGPLQPLALPILLLLFLLLLIFPLLHLRFFILSSHERITNPSCENFCPNEHWLLLSSFIVLIDSNIQGDLKVELATTWVS